MASGDTLFVFFPTDGEPPASNAATLDSRTVAPVLDFDDTTDESIEFGGFMPRNYAGGGVTITYGWMGTTATSGTVSVDIAFKSLSDDADDLDTKAFASPQNSNPTAASASGEIDYATDTFTDGAQMDSVAAGEYFRMLFTRDANGTTSTDNMAGDMELVFVEGRET